MQREEGREAGRKEGRKEVTPLAAKQAEQVEQRFFVRAIH